MSTTSTETFSNIYNLELKLREKLAQLQFKEEALKQSQIQLTESKNFACKLQIVLENECRISNQVRSELKSAMELIVELEDEKIHGQTERARLEINFQNARINYDNLVNQTRKTKLENVMLQRKNEILEANLSEQKMINQIITESIKDLRNQINKLYPTIRSNVEKLKQEQNYLCNSFKAAAQLNRRIGNSTKIDYKQNSEYIK